MFYDKKIKYVDVYENGEKVHSAGFVRIEVKEKLVRFWIQISGLQSTDTMTCPVVLLSGEREGALGEIHLNHGRGVGEFTQPDATEMAGGVVYEELEEIHVRPGGTRLLRCVVRERVQKQENLPVESTVQEKTVEPEVKSEAELLKEAFLAEKRLREGEHDNAVQQNIFEKAKEINQEETPTLSVMQESGTKQFLVVQEPQAMDKWQQLLAVYPHIRPFEDHREYLLMKPQDFVILAEKYFSLSENSFLLHGYYNYDHLIMSKERRTEGEQVYIGVPGNFYDKEKQVAIMFGFESFEGKREPARSGDFGYYMIPVEI